MSSNSRGYDRAYYEANKERINKRHAEYWRENREKLNRRRKENLTYRNVIKPKECTRCGSSFMPSSNYRKICDECLTTQQVRALTTAQEPCSKCCFLPRCKLEIRRIDGWPLCWAASPDRDEFMQVYLGESSMQGSLARTLAELEQE